MSLEYTLQYYNARINAIKMLQCRGYYFGDSDFDVPENASHFPGAPDDEPIPRVEDLMVTFETFRTMYPDKINIIGPVSPDGKRTLVLFKTEPGLSLISEHLFMPPNGILSVAFKLAGLIMSDLKAETLQSKRNGILEELLEDTHVLIVYSQDTPSKFEGMYEDRRELEFFRVEKLAIEISNSIIQPDFKLLDKTERTELLKHFNEREFVMYAKDDAMVHYFNGYPGDIFEIKDRYGVRYRRVGDFKKEKKLG